MSEDAQVTSSIDDLIYDWNKIESLPKQLAITLDDETLRDGLQSPSVTDPDVGDKIEILHLMNALRIHTADIGLPAAGPRAYADVERLAIEARDAKLDIRVNCAARTNLRDVRAIADIAQTTGIPIMAAIFLGSSEIRRYVEDWDLANMLSWTAETIDFAVKEGIEVMYVTEDTTRAKPSTIDMLYRTAIEHGASRICICDTVGHATPMGVRSLVKHVKALASDSQVKIDWHSHNDRGLALANTLMALQAGVDGVHACALGIGERCGNTSMDQLLVNLYLMGYAQKDVDLANLRRYVDKVSDAFGVHVPANYPVFGRDAFQTATGVHAAAVLKASRKGNSQLSNYIYSGVPADIFGLEQKISIGSLSGRSNVALWLERRGITATEDVIEHILNAAKRSNRTLTDVDVYALIDDVTAQARVPSVHERAYVGDMSV